MSKLTIGDIARLADVSTATVSRALHSPHLLRPETLRRVLDTIDEHKYIYNALAGDLSKQKSSVLGIYVPTVESAKLSETVFALQETVQAHGYPVIVNNTNFNAELEKTQLRQARERSLSGLFLIGYMRENLPYIDEIIRGGIPCFFLWDTLPGTDYNYVGFDNQSAAYNMASHLLGLGHQLVAFVGAMQSQIDRVRKRLNGYLSALEQRGAPVRPELIREAPPTLENGYRVMESFLNMKPGSRPTAVFFASDMLALGAMAACRQRGLQVPEEISIAGFDNIEFAIYGQPALTTVYVPSREIGQLAGRFLMEAIQRGEPGPHQRCLETSLLIRESCAPPRR
ncbi:MAG: LacI family transcriptional regulator [Deltaproteobacteria bacterium]|jgi:DNA-binding LacI/PurR family transcriptional regulator|nr:LacI family transcriptional regulator [Deltaproteobacteria bacterium]